MITIDKEKAPFVFASFRERYYSATSSTGGFFQDFLYTSPVGYDEYDATAVGGSKKRPCVLEFKVRDFESTKYDTAMIDRKKYNALLRRHSRTGEVPIYYCFYTDGVMLAFNLLKCQDLDLEETTTNKFTMNPSAGRHRKLIYNLPIDRAKRFVYTVPTDEQVKAVFYTQFTVV